MRPVRKAGQSYHLHVPIVLKCGSLIFLESQGLSRPVQGFFYILLCMKRFVNRLTLTQN